MKTKKNVKARLRKATKRKPIGGKRYYQLGLYDPSRPDEEPQWVNVKFDDSREDKEIMKLVMEKFATDYVDRGKVVQPFPFSEAEGAAF